LVGPPVPLRRFSEPPSSDPRQKDSPPCPPLWNLSVPRWQIFSPHLEHTLGWGI
jgi:hypothetical protein